MPEPLLLGLLAAAAILAVAHVALMLRSPRRRVIAATLVGITGGLESAQIGKVHLFVLAVGVFLLAASETKARIAPAATIVVCAGIVASTVLYGPLVVSRITGIQFMLLASCAAALAAKASADYIWPILKGLLGISSAAAVLAIAQYVGVVPLTLFHDAARPTGLLYTEPDFLGLYTAIGALIAFRSPLRNRWKYALVAVNGIAMLLSSARAAWVGLGVAVLITFVLHHRGESRRILRSAAVLAAVLGIVLAVDGSLRTYTLNRIEAASSAPQSNAVQGPGHDYSAQARRNQQDSLIELGKTAPWYGQGLTASGRVLIYGGLDFTGQTASKVGSNWLLSDWAEGKYLAIPLIGLFLLAAARRARDVTGMVLVLVLVNNLFSNALRPITWLALGLAMAPALRHVPLAIGPRRGRVCLLEVLDGASQPGRERAFPTHGEHLAQAGTGGALMRRARAL